MRNDAIELFKLTLNCKLRTMNLIQSRVYGPIRAAGQINWMNGNRERKREREAHTHVASHLFHDIALSVYVCLCDLSLSFGLFMGRNSKIAVRSECGTSTFVDSMIYIGQGFPFRGKLNHEVVSGGKFSYMLSFQQQHDSKNNRYDKWRPCAPNRR